jgi:trk system potassium uptake protein TrkH
MMMMEVLNTLSMEGLVRFVKVIVAISLLMESVGALILAIRFSFDMDPLRALYFGIFHAVSAFNNAGFSLFSENFNLVAYRTDLTVNLTITTLIVLGGIGFLVYRDILENLRGQRFRLSTHTKLALLVSLLLIVGGTVGIWAFEVLNEKTLAGMPFGDQVLVAYFHSISARTAGFTTMDLSLMATPTLYLLILLMIIGASPGGTGGGIKTTTFGIICASIWAMLKGRADVMMFHRRIPQELVMKAFVLSALAFGLITGFTMLLSYSESQSFLKIMFEVASAAGTVGLSTGNGGVLSLSALFSDFGKVIIIATMFLGRLGPLALGLFAVKTHEDLRYRYAEARVVLG